MSKIEYIERDKRNVKDDPDFLKWETEFTQLLFKSRKKQVGKDTDYEICIKLIESIVESSWHYKILSKENSVKYLIGRIYQLAKRNGKIKIPPYHRLDTKAKIWDDYINPQKNLH